jgi:hypothetical protein
VKRITFAPDGYVSVEDGTPPEGWGDDDGTTWHLDDPWGGHPLSRPFMRYGVRFRGGVGYTDNPRVIELFEWRATRPRTDDFDNPNDEPYRAAAEAWLALKP